MSLDRIFGTTSILCLTAISLERMYAVRYPTEHRNLKNKSVYCVITAIWVFGLIITFMKFGLPLESRERIYILLVLGLDFLVPLLVIIACYTCIFRTARTMMTPTNQKRNISMELKVAKTISVIIGLFVFSWLPFFALNTTIEFCDRNKCKYVWTQHWPVFASKALHYSNSMMNFLVYAVRSPDFRQTFKALLLQKCNHDIIREKMRTLSIEKKKKLVIVEECRSNPNLHGDSKNNGDDLTKFLTTDKSDYSMATVTSELPPSNNAEDEKLISWLCLVLLESNDNNSCVPCKGNGTLWFLVGACILGGIPSQVTFIWIRETSFSENSALRNVLTVLNLIF